MREETGGTFDLDYRSSFEIYTGELQHIVTVGPATLVLGGRFESGQFDTQVRLTDYANSSNPAASALFLDPPARQDVVVDFERLSLYVYNTWRVTRWLTLSAGVTYDSMDSPDNFQSPPVNSRQQSIDEVSPKGGLVLSPWRGATIRAAYSQSVGGASFDENIRLERSQMAGFLNTYRTLAPESVTGPLAGSHYKLAGVSFEQKLPTRTYLGVDYPVLQQDVDRTIGVFDSISATLSAPVSRLQHSPRHCVKRTSIERISSPRQ